MNTSISPNRSGYFSAILTMILKAVILKAGLFFVFCHSIIQWSNKLDSSDSSHSINSNNFKLSLLSPSCLEFRLLMIRFECCLILRSLGSIQCLIHQIALHVIAESSWQPISSICPKRVASFFIFAIRSFGLKDLNDKRERASRSMSSDFGINK